MPKFAPSIEIDAPKEHVFALAADVTKQPDWAIFIKEVAIKSGDGKSAGTTDETVIKIGPQKHRLEGTWTEYTPGEVLGHNYTGYLKLRDRLTFTPSGNGTRVQWSVDYTPPFGMLGKIMAAFMMARVFQNDVEASLDNLKAALES